ncbi:hypothetical protein ACFOHW_05900 [Paenibacillus abyssi]|uniref:hypothetical protein n=1 Tax=Paenibacillus abyssi TaxID=1340531 RepID=UPI00360E5D12
MTHGRSRLLEMAGPREWDHYYFIAKRSSRKKPGNLGLINEEGYSEWCPSNVHQADKR